MLYRALKRRADANPQKIAVVGEQRMLSFGQLLGEVDHAARFLRELKVESEHPILLGVPPSPDFYVIFYAACTLGATVIPVLPSGKIPETIVALGPRIAVGEPEFLATAKARCPTIRETIDWDRQRGCRIPPLERKPFFRRRLVRQEKIVALLTSGTTGEPTLHFTNAETLLRHGELRARVLGIRPDDVLLSTRPFNNMSSIDAPLILPVVAGSRVVLRETFRRFEAAETMAQERVTVVYGVPIVFEMLASVPAHFPGDFSSLRLCVSGGAPLPRYVFDKFYKRFGIKIQQRYGGTHFFPAFNFDTRGLPGSVGHLSAPFPMAIIDESGNVAPPGAIGEIVLNFSRLRNSFWRDCLRDNPDRRGKYLYTGDLGRADKEGNIFIVGRKSPFIKVGGNRVAPAEVESVLRSNPKVRDTLVVPYHPGQHDEAVHAIVVPSGRLNRHELLAYCAQHLDAYKCPRRIDFRKDLPRNAQGKIVRHDTKPNRNAARGI